MKMWYESEQLRLYENIFVIVFSIVTLPLLSYIASISYNITRSGVYIMMGMVVIDIILFYCGCMGVVDYYFGGKRE